MHVTVTDPDENFDRGEFEVIVEPLPGCPQKGPMVRAGFIKNL